MTRHIWQVIFCFYSSLKVANFSRDGHPDRHKYFITSPINKIAFHFFIRFYYSVFLFILGQFGVFCPYEVRISISLFRRQNVSPCKNINCCSSLFYYCLIFLSFF